MSSCIESFPAAPIGATESTSANWQGCRVRWFREPGRSSKCWKPNRKTPRAIAKPAEQVSQLNLFSAGSGVIDQLLGMDVTQMTPLEAIKALYRLQEMARND